MDLAGALINAFVVVAVGGILTWITVDRSRHLRTELMAELGRVEAKLGTDISRVEGRTAGLHGAVAEIKGEIARLEDRMDVGFNAVRSDLTAVALAVGAASPRSSGQD